MHDTSNHRPAGVAEAEDELARELRGFGPVGIVALLAILFAGNVAVAPMLILPAGATLALLWRWASRTPWREIGYVRPRSWVAAILIGIVCGSAFKIAMKMIVMPLFGADPVNQAYRFLTGNTALLPSAVWAMFVAGFGEETVFRGFLFERFGKLIGRSAAAKVTAVLMTSAWFGIVHYADQGFDGAAQATIVGLVFGSAYATTGRLFTLMVAHTAFDLTALALIYWNLETAVARFLYG